MRQENSDSDYFLNNAPYQLLCSPKHKPPSLYEKRGSGSIRP